MGSKGICVSPFLVEPVVPFCSLYYVISFSYFLLFFFQRSVTEVKLSFPPYSSRIITGISVV